MTRSLPSLLLFLLCACWRAQVPTAVEVKPDEPPPALPPPPPPPIEPSLFAPWYYEGRCPIGMTLVEGGQFTRTQLIRLNGLFAERTIYDFGDPIPDFCLAVEETSYLEYWNCVRAGYCKEDQDKLEMSAARWPLKCVYDKAECPDAMQPLAIGMLQPKMAEEYCSAREARLPTIVEWYWAALGGTEDRHYTWGNTPPTEALLNVCDLQCAQRNCDEGRDAWCMQNTPRALQGDDGYWHWAPTDAYPAGAGRWGQLNMLGNVPEYVRQTKGELRNCGGSDDTNSLAALDLYGDVCNTNHQNIGVRCAAPAREL